MLKTVSYVKDLVELLGYKLKMCYKITGNNKITNAQSHIKV